MEKLEIKNETQQLNPISIAMVNPDTNSDSTTIKSLNNRILMLRQRGTFEPHKMAKHTFCPTLISPSAVTFKKPSRVPPKPEPRTWFTEMFSTIVEVKKKLYQQPSPKAKTEVLLLSIKQADQSYRTFFVLNNRPFPMQRITEGEDWGKKKYAVDREWLNHFERLYFKFYYKEPYVPLKPDEFAK